MNLSGEAERPPSQQIQWVLWSVPEGREVCCRKLALAQNGNGPLFPLALQSSKYHKNRIHKVCVWSGQLSTQLSWWQETELNTGTANEIGFGGGTKLNDIYRKTRKYGDEDAAWKGAETRYAASDGSVWFITFAAVRAYHLAGKTDRECLAV